MRLLSFIFLTLTLSLVYSKWAAPVEITSYVDPTKISQSMYTDSVAGITYIAYCNSTDGLSYYAYLDNSGLFLIGPQILNPILRCYHIEISGPHDGENVYIAMEARRSLTLETCSKEFPDACDDLYIFHSSDAGETWDPPKNVGGTPGDIIRRREFTMLNNWNTPYLWFVYNKYIGTQLDITTIRYDTKKGAFDKEEVLVEKYGSMNYYPLITIGNDKKTNLVLYYTTPYTLKIQRMISTDEGITWKKEEPIKRLCSEDKSMSYKTILSKGKYIIAGCSKNNDIYFSFSEDLGKTWTTPVKFTEGEIEEVFFCNAVDPIGPEAYLLILNSKGKGFKMSHATIPPKEYKNAYVPNQLYYLGGRLHANCYYIENELRVRFMYQMRQPYEGVSKYLLYILDNDNLVTTPESEHTKPKEDL